MHNNAMVLPYSRTSSRCKDCHDPSHGSDPCTPCQRLVSQSILARYDTLPLILTSVVERPACVQYILYSITPSTAPRNMAVGNTSDVNGIQCYDHRHGDRRVRARSFFFTRAWPSRTSLTRVQNMYDQKKCISLTLCQQKEVAKKKKQYTLHVIAVSRVMSIYSQVFALSNAAPCWSTQK